MAESNTTSVVFLTSSRACEGLKGEYGQPNSNSDKSDHGCISIAEHGNSKPAVDSLSNQSSNAGSDNHNQCYEPGYLARGELAEESEARIDHGDKEAAADSDSCRDFEDINQQGNENEISRAQEPDEDSRDH